MRFIAIKSTNLMNFDGLYRFRVAVFCNEVVIYRYYQRNRRLIAINRPNLADFDDMRILESAKNEQDP